MRYRKLSPTGDYTFGRGQADFYRDVPEAPGQAVTTRLHLRKGEWFLDTSDGTPWSTEVLGKYTLDTRDRMLRMRTLGTMGVTGIATYSSQFNPETREFAASITVDTAYGKISLTEPL